MSEEALVEAKEKLVDGDELERHCLAMKQERTDVFHHFPEEGVYLREARFAAGLFVVGHHQNFEHTNIFAQGRVTMVYEDGRLEELKAPMVFRGKPGRKIGFIHEDVVWYNVYATKERDVEKLEAHFLTKTELAKGLLPSPEKVMQAIEARRDYVAVIGEFGFTEEQVQEQVNRDDVIEMPVGKTYKFQLGPSSIHGKGVFAVAEIEVGEEIGVARLGENRTPLGRFTNHSNKPNARMFFTEDGNIYLFAISKIKGNTGGILGDEIVIDYREPLNKIYNQNNQ